ncbi:MFS transporter [Sulfobacillus harzensis]
MAVVWVRERVPDLPRDVWWVIAVNASMQAIFNFVTIFVNLYWWRQGESILAVSLFNLAGTVALFASYFLGSHYLYKRDIRFVMLLSSIFAGVTFLALFFYVPGWRTLFTLGIGMAFGLTQGFFWAANNSSMYTFLKSEQYADYFSINTVLGQAIAVAIPLISAGIVGAAGFRLSFLIMLVFVLAAFVVSIRLPHKGLAENLFQGRIGFREVFAKPGTAWVMAVVMCTGLVNQFLTLFSMIYIFTVSNNVGIVALLNIGYSFILLAALTWYRRAHFSQDVWLVMGIVLILASYGLAFLVPKNGWSTIVVLLMRVGGLYLQGASGRQRYRVIMQGDVVWRTRFGLWMEFPFALSRTTILIGGLFVRTLGDAAFIVLTAISSGAMLALPLFTRMAIRRYEAAHGVGAGL